MPACRFPPCSHRKSRRVNPTIPSAAFSMQIKYKRLSPHVPRTSPFSSAIFHAARTLSGSLRSPPSPRGKALSVVILFPHMCVFALTLWGKRYSRIVAFPAWGRGTAPAVDRVLSLTAHLRRIFHLFHLSFIPPVPYPPLRGTFPSRGRLTIRGKPAVKRPSGIALFRHPERRETSYER